MAHFGPFPTRPVASHPLRQRGWEAAQEGMGRQPCYGVGEPDFLGGRIQNAVPDPNPGFLIFTQTPYFPRFFVDYGM
jgi:hypothetical protein